MEKISHGIAAVNVRAVSPQGGFLSLDPALEDHRKLTWTRPDGQATILTDQIGPLDAVISAMADDHRVVWVHRHGANPAGPWDIWVFDHKAPEAIPVKITSSETDAVTGRELTLPWPFPHLVGDLIYWQQSPKLGTVTGYGVGPDLSTRRVIIPKLTGRTILIGENALMPDPERPGYLQRINLKDGSIQPGPQDPGFFYSASDGVTVVGTTKAQQFWTWDGVGKPVLRLSTTPVWMQYPEVWGRWAYIDEQNRAPIIDLESGSYVDFWTSTRRAEIVGAGLVITDQGPSHLVMLRDLEPLPRCH